MKKARFLLIIMLCITLLISMQACSAQMEEAAAEYTPLPSTPYMSESQLEEAARQDKTSAAYRAILEQVAEDPNEYLTTYAAEYGGAYYEDGKMHVLLTDASAPMIEKYKSMVEDDGDIVFHEAAYSLNAILETQRLLEPLLFESGVLFGGGIDEKHNVYLVTVQSSDYEAAMRLLPTLLEALNENAVYFEAELTIETVPPPILFETGEFAEDLLAGG